MRPFGRTKNWFGLLAALLGGATAALAAASDDGAAIDACAARARRAGLRVLAGEHLVLATDRPDREGDGVPELPAIFDQAFAAWCRHFDIDPAACRSWRAFGCLVVDRETFRAAGLLPDGIPEFRNGFCDRARFWMMDQSNPAYRRHLLLHEGVHAFTLTLRDLNTPPWYTEGIAEFLATHRLEPAGQSGAAGDAAGPARFVATPIPQRPEDVEQLGRIERLRALRAAENCPGLEAVFATPAADHQDLSAYAASWAAVALLRLHPTHSAAFTAAERGPVDFNFTDRLTRAPGFDAARAGRDFDAFTDDVDYGYDFTRSGIDWDPGRPLEAVATVEVESDRGWQNSGMSLTAGRRYAVAARGRCTIGFLAAEAGAAPVRLETEPAGITLRWYRGRPLGRLLVAQWREPADGRGRPGFAVVAAGDSGTFTAVADGPAFFKLNDPPGELADNAGRLTAEIRPVP